MDGSWEIRQVGQRRESWTEIVTISMSRKGAGWDASGKLEPAGLIICGERKKFKAVLSDNVHPHPWAPGICVCVGVVWLGSEFSFGISPLTGGLLFVETQFFFSTVRIASLLVVKNAPKVLLWFLASIEMLAYKCWSSDIPPTFTLSGEKWFTRNIKIKMYLRNIEVTCLSWIVLF